MLSLLHIENIAVIERADIELGHGLTVLTGETGAGKSILLDAIGALLGQRTSRELVRSGAEKGFVSAIFTDLPIALRSKLEELELTGEEPDTLHLQRQLSVEGKSSCRVNMRPVTVSTLKMLSPFLINIHGQHDGQRLLDAQYHIEYLDSFAGSHSLLTKYLPLYQHLSALKRKITALDQTEQERLQRMERLRYQAEEIEAASLLPYEEEPLLARKAVCDHANQLSGALELAYRALDGSDDGEEAGACAIFGHAADALASVEEISEEIRALAQRAEELRFLARDLADSVGIQRSSIEFSPQESAAIEERLDLIYQMKNKYGSTISDVLAYYAQITEELEQLSNADETRECLREEYRTGLIQAKKIASALTELRRESAVRLKEAIVSQLTDLDMPNACLEIRVETGSKLGQRGLDSVEFLISVNPGEPVKPLSKVASGGELSRIMLAMKNILTVDEPVGTLIFDEIDTGVSGRAAQKIARKLASISAKKQTMCVTHLPQIAAMGEQHLLITKSVQHERSFTDVVPLIEDARTAEIARMISGDHITETTRNNAKELLESARVSKTENTL